MLCQTFGILFRLSIFLTYDSSLHLPSYVGALGFLCDKYAKKRGEYDENFVQTTKIGRFYLYIVRLLYARCSIWRNFANVA